MKLRKIKRFQPLGITRRNDLKDLPLASFARRLMAYAIDIMVVIILIAVASIPHVLAEGAPTGNYHFEINPFHGWALLSLPAYVGLWTYFGRGQTIGKKLLGIRVVSLAHERLTLWHSIERSLGYAASFLEGGFGFIQYFFNPNCQTVHDRIAETIVVLDSPKQRIAPPNQTPEPTTPGVRGSS
jgi:uncharacterized RDD family membrane protein YckC